jgi:hypothetical protein
MLDHRERHWVNYVGFWLVLFFAAGLLVLSFYMVDRLRQGLPELPIEQRER